jgi:glycosyltransferase involved in cell wall biosynthesis
LSERASVYRKIIFTWIANQFHIPVLIHANGADFRDFFEGLPTRHQAFVSRSLGRCHYFIAVTKFWRDYYVNHVGLDDKQVLVLPNPAKLPDTVPSRSNALVVKLIFLGRIGHRKGAYDLIRAYHSLSLDIQQKSELIMAGDGDLHEAQQLINELKLMERIRLLGWVNPIKRDQLLQESDVFILPSYNEGLPLAMIEAMGWGLPIITTPIAGIPEVVTPEHNGFLIEPGNIQLLARSIQVLIDNETLRLSMGKAARKTVETFDIKYYSDRIASIYSDMLSKT